ncbi:MAG TPA: tetratricopeptide repeat-containing sensor histidine kinase [Fulvivirga sp.]|nr:tetratricopeptide repeat-containing sensor histidine kinase [Fulvivirga sp.]
MLRTTVLMLFIVTSVRAQYADSLLNVLSKVDDPKTRVDIYNAIVDEYWHTNTKEAILYSDSAFQLSSTIKDYVPGLVQSLTNKGISAYTLGDYASAMDYYFQAIKLGNTHQIDTKRIFEYYLVTLKNKGDYQILIKSVDSVLNIEDANADFKVRLNFLKASTLIILGELNEAKNILDYLEQSDSKTVTRASQLVQKAALENLSGNFKLALKYLNEANKYYKDRGDSLDMANTNKELGRTYILLGQFDKALLAINQSLKIYKNANYPFGIAQSRYQLGYLYAELGKNDLSIDNYYEALRIFENQSNKKELAECYFDLAYMYSTYDMPKAMELINESINVSRQIANKFTESIAFNYLGTFYSVTNQLDSSLYAYNKAIELRKELGYDYLAAEFNVGTVYEKMGNFKKAEELYLLTYPIEIRRGNTLGTAISEYTLGGLYTKMGKYNEAILFLENAYDKLVKIEAHGYLLECLHFLVHYYETINDPAKALYYLKEHNEIKDSVYSTDKEIHIAEIETRYEIEKKEREIEVLSLENKNRLQSIELQKKKISNQRFLIALILVGIFSVVVLFLVTYKLLMLKNKANKELTELNKEISDQSEEIAAQSEELREANEEILSLNESLEEKVTLRTEELRNAHKELDTFFYHASHDFRRPLTTFLGLAEIANTILEDPKALELFEKVKETAGSLDRMVGKLKAISIIGFDKIVYAHVDFNELIGKQLIRHKKLISERNIAVNIDLAVKKVRSSYDLIEIILDNLLENSILYSRSDVNALVNIETTEGQGMLKLKVTDNGQGIEDELKSKIFNMYYRANEASQGNGLGLYIAKKAVEKLGGTIEFESEYEQGSTFIAQIPLST